MASHWYAVYTRSQKEKKVTACLSKKNIEAYCPVVFQDGKREAARPLFSSFVFVKLNETQMELVQKIPDIINFIYWRSKPAVIHKDEIDMLKRLTSKYTVVSLLKSVVENNGLLRVLDGPSVYSNGNSIALRYDNVKVNLPSIGYTIVAERGETAEAAPAKGQTGFFGAFPKRISSLLFN